MDNNQICEITDTDASKQSDGATPAKKRLGLGQALPVAFILISIVWIYIGLTEFGFFNKFKGGTPGFLPVIVAAVMLVASLMALAKSFKEETPKLNPMCFGFLAMCGAVVGLSLLIGLLPALLLFAFAWIKLIEKNPWKGTIAVLLVLAVIGYGLFQFALHVTFPVGLLFELV